MKYFPIVVVLSSALFPLAILEASAASSKRLPVVHLASRDDFDNLLVDAWKLYQERKYDEAIKLCEKAIQLRPSDNRGYAIAGVAYMGLWKMREASDILALAIKFSPGNAVLHYNKARADRYRNAKEEGLVSVRKAIELKPDYAEAHLLLGDLLSIGSSGDRSAQIAAFRKAIELKPTLLQAYRELGMSLEVSGDKKGAEEAYRKGLEMDPKKALGFFDLGRLLVDLNRLKEARELWEKRPPVKDSTYPNFITLLERAEKVEAAKQEFERSPNDPDAILQMGLVTMEGESWVVDDRWERAIGHFRKALEISPKFANTQHALCRAYVEWAAFNKDKNVELDKELAILRSMDTKLADEVVEYRKTFFGGIRTTGPPPPAKKP